MRRDDYSPEIAKRGILSLSMEVEMNQKEILAEIRRLRKEYLSSLPQDKRYRKFLSWVEKRGDIPLDKKKRLGSLLEKVPFPPLGVHFKDEVGKFSCEEFEEVLFHWQSKTYWTYNIFLLSSGRILSTWDSCPFAERMKHPVLLNLDEGDYLHSQTGKVFYKTYLRNLKVLEPIPARFRDLLLSGSTGLLDTPQERIIAFYEKMLFSRLPRTLDIIRDVLEGKDPFKVSLLEILSREEHKQIDLPGPLQKAIKAFLHNTCLLDEPEEVFDVSLREIFFRFWLEAEKKAESLKKEVLDKFGFEGVWGGWQKGKLYITQEGDIEILGRRVCIILKDRDFPLPDIIANKILLLSSEARYKIATIAWDQMEELERIFPIEKKGRFG